MNVQCEAKLTMDLEALMARGEENQNSTQEALEDSRNDTKTQLERIKRQLSSSSGNVPLQGPLLKRSETLRKWNQRWFSLDPATGKMEYRLERGDLTARGQIYFNADSTITISPINFQGDKRYDGCCFYIGTPHKKEYYFCAESQAVARAWVGTLRAAALVLKAHKEAVSSLSGNGAAKLGTVAAVVAAANTVAREAARDISAEMQSSIKATLSVKSSQAPEQDDGALDNFTIMKETLRVKDEELHQLSKELRARDVTIKELADRLSQTADAADQAAQAAHAMDRERKAARAQVDRARKELDDRTKVAMLQLKAGEQRYTSVVRERDEAVFEIQRLQQELAKVKEQVALLERNAKKPGDEAQKGGEAEATPVLSKEKKMDANASSINNDHSDEGDRGLLVNTPSESTYVAEGERAFVPDNEEEKEAVKSEVVEGPTVVEAVPSEREVLIDTYSADVDVSSTISAPANAPSL